MKALFYKFSRSFGIRFLGMLYFWFLVPFFLILQSDFLISITSPLCFLPAGMVYIFEASQNEKEKFNKYISYSTIKRSSYVSYFYILMIISHVIMYGIVMLLGYAAPNLFDMTLLTSNSPLIALSSMILSLAVTGIPLIIYFGKSYNVSAIIYLMSYFLMSFSLGFVKGFFEGEETPAVLESLELRMVIGLVSGVIFVFEWWLSVRLYSKRDI